MCRRVLAERFPDSRDPRPRSSSVGEPGRGATPATAGCSIPSTARRTTRTACRSSARRSALEIDGALEVAAIYDPTRRELFTAERGGGAYLNGAPLRVSSAVGADRRAARHRLPVRRARATPTRSLGLFGEFVTARAGRAATRVGRARSGYVAAGRFDGVLGRQPPAVGRGGGKPARGRGGRTGVGHGRHAVRRPRTGHVLAATPGLQAPMLETIREFRAARSRNRTT